MLVAQRHLKIVELIQQNGSVQVEALAETLGVSPMTIRRDLVKLQAAGVIERCHGGAVAKQEVTYKDKQTSHMPEKKQLARTAAVHVAPGDHIFLDAGTTTYEIARLIQNIPQIRVLTNDLEIARLLKKSEINIMFLGGALQNTTGSTWGYYATQMLSDFKFDLGFLGAAFINDKFQVTTPTAEKAFLKRAAVGQCQKAFLVIDESKFGRQSTTVVNDLGDYYGVITTKAFTESECAVLQKMHANINIV